MRDRDCVAFLQWAVPQLRMRWPGFRKVRGQVCKRIRQRLRMLGLPDVQSYRDFLAAHPEEWCTLDSFCRISISRFYRDQRVFDVVRDRVLPQLARDAESAKSALRCWSAGCASGEEPYTLNIIWRLCVQARFPNVNLRILATDSDPHMLERARRAVYPSSSVKDLPADWVPQAFKRENEFRLRDEFRANVEFELRDLRDPAPDGPFHLVLCRYLPFTYFDPQLQHEVFTRIVERIAPRGFLIIGKTESLPNQAALIELQPHTRIFEIES